MSSVNDTPRRGLGRGLEVLIGGAGEAELLHLPVEAVHPNPRQPRRRNRMGAGIARHNQPAPATASMIP